MDNKKNDFEITELDNDQEAKIRGGEGCGCAALTSLVDSSVNKICGGAGAEAQ